MKRLMLVVAMAATVVACKKDNDVFRIDPDKDVLIIQGVEKHPQIALRNKTPRQKNTYKSYTIHECLEDTTLTIYMEGAGYWTFKSQFKDLENDRLVLPANEVIAYNPDGSYRVVRELIDSKELIFFKGPLADIRHPEVDTCGYIPQSVVRRARQKIDSLFAIEDYEGMLDVLHNDFVFYPCTGAEYKELKAQGLN